MSPLGRLLDRRTKPDRHVTRVKSDTETLDDAWECVELQNDDLRTPQGGSCIFELVGIRVIPKQDQKSL